MELRLTNVTGYGSTGEAASVSADSEIFGNEDHLIGFSLVDFKSRHTNNYLSNQNRSEYVMSHKS